MSLGQYAVWECSDCGVGAPSNEMTKVADRVLDRTTSSMSVRRGVNGGFGVGSGSANSYRMVPGQICTSCFAFREQQRRKAARSRLIGGLLVTIGLVFAVILILPTKQAPTPVLSTPVEVPAAVNAAPVAEPAAPVDLLPPAAKEITPEATTSEDTNSTPVGIAEAGQVADAVVGDDSIGRDAVRDAVVGATHDALISGRAKRWHAKGMQGFIVVSEEQLYGDRSCRNVYSTNEAAGPSADSPTRVWCRSGSEGEWTQQPLGG